MREIVVSSGLHDPDWSVPSFEIGWWGRTVCTGRGFVGEAAAAILRRGFEDLGARRISAAVNEDNGPSCRICERIGMDLESTFRNARANPDGGLRHFRLYASITQPVRPAAQRRRDVAGIAACVRTAYSRAAAAGVSPMTKKLFVKSYGCQMNVHDAERMAELLAGQGYEATDKAEEADMVLLNTCHIREKAAEKVYSDIGRLRPLRAARPDLRIAVAGCVAQAEGAEIIARAPSVDLVVGPQSYQHLPELLARVERGEKVVETEFPAEDKFARLPSRRTRAPAAFLTVQEGCDKFCSFCVVPYTRGAEVSRPLARIVDEARGLVGQGVREVTLLGQNVNAWHGAEGGLAALVRALAEIEGLDRIRYTTSHPNDMDDALIAAHGEEPKLMPFLHLPVQSGSDRILKAMNRKHRAADYLRLVGRLRAARPDLLLSSDFITGFPGETEEDFQATLSLVEAVRFGSAFTFAYSPRPGTPAAERPQVDAEEAHDRLLRLQAVIVRQQRGAQEGMVGRIVPVLFEKPGRMPGQMTGKSEHLMAVSVTGPDSLRGEIVPVRITEALTNSLAGEITA